MKAAAKSSGKGASSSGGGGGMKAGGGGGKGPAGGGKGPPHPAHVEEDDGEYYGLTSVGTLIVRIVSARGLPAVTAGGFFSSGSSNPYAMLEFEGSTQGTSVVPNTTEPVWPREQYFFQVKMPVMHAEADEDGYGGLQLGGSGSASASAGGPLYSTRMNAKLGGGGGGDLGKGGKMDKLAMFSSSEPHLHVMLVHKEGGAAAATATAGDMMSAASSSADTGSHAADFDPTVFTKPGKGGKGGGGAGNNGVPPGDRLLGEAFVNIVDLATARVKSLDEWFPLSEGGAVRLVVEYDVLEPPPQPGEMVRLLGFGAATDLWPLPLREEMQVQKYVDANRDRLLVTYETPEGWNCQAEVHRFHVMSAGRHQTLRHEYQNKALDWAIGVQAKFEEAPFFQEAGNVLDKICDGVPPTVVLEEVGGRVVSTVSRWCDLGFIDGLGEAFHDVTRAFKPPARALAELEEGVGLLPGDQAAGGGKMDKEDIYKAEEEESYRFEYLSREQVARITCPITNEPFRDPVLASDGCTYERTAILRWLAEGNDTSPVTRQVIKNKDVYECRAMRETVEEYRARNEELRRQAEGVGEAAAVAFGVHEVGGGKKEEKEAGEEKSGNLKREEEEEEVAEVEEEKKEAVAASAPLEKKEAAASSPPADEPSSSISSSVLEVLPPPVPVAPGSGKRGSVGWASDLTSATRTALSATPLPPAATTTEEIGRAHV